jgi:integrase
MKAKYWLCKRNGNFFSFDSETKKRESLYTQDKAEAIRLVRAKNDASVQPALNVSIARAYLVGADPRLMERTWSFVIQEFYSRKKENSRLRLERAFKSPAFNFIRAKKLISTTAEDFFAVMKAGGVYTQHILRCLHNLALGMGWLLVPVIPSKLWPKSEKRHRRAITFDEHRRIVETESNAERKLYYQLLWEIGASQTDGANLKSENVNWDARLLSYNRQKTGQPCVLEIGEKLEGLLKLLPSSGQLFPKISNLKDKDRSAEFCRRCRILEIKGVSLQSYRYAWAGRAKKAGMPERFAQSALGHASVAVHREYAREGIAICPSLENYERKAAVRA